MSLPHASWQIAKISVLRHYYNMACVYALLGRKELALRYLQIAAMNGYATAEGMDGDPDLEAVRGEPAYRALVRTKL